MIRACHNADTSTKVVHPTRSTDAALLPDAAVNEQAQFESGTLPPHVGHAGDAPPGFKNPEEFPSAENGTIPHDVGHSPAEPASVLLHEKKHLALRRWRRER